MNIFYINCNIFSIVMSALWIIGNDVGGASMLSPAHHTSEHGDATVLCHHTWDKVKMTLVIDLVSVMAV